MEAHPDLDVVEMDTVKGGNASGKCRLTLLFRSCNFMLVILLSRCTQDCVIHAINELSNTLGLRTFRKYFPVILTDNGSEFKNPYDIEKQKMENIVPTFFTVTLMYQIKKENLKRTMNSYAMSFQKDAVCISILRKISTS